MNCADCGKHITGRGKTSFCYRCQCNHRKKHSEETKKKISEGHMGILPWNKDLKTGPLSEETKYKISQNHADCSGIKNGRYIDGRCKILGTFYDYIRDIKEYAYWRTLVFRRDNYKCLECGKGGKLHAHHKRQLKYIIQDFIKKYSEYSPKEDKEILIKLALSYAPFWDLDNGETLCEECHKLVEHKVRG